jgi:hypothetical protein
MKRRSTTMAAMTAAVAMAVMGLVSAATANAAQGAMIVPATGSVTGYYGGYCTAYDEPPAHSGIDIANNAGGPILAAASGTVTFAGNNGKSYGNFVSIGHDASFTTVYAHLASFSVRSGQTVSKGQQIGVMGNTGASTGTHLHFEVIKEGVQQRGLNAYFGCGKTVTRGTAIGYDFPGLGGTSTAALRIGSLSPDGTLSVKENALNAGWSVVATRVTSFDLAGDRIGIVDFDGKASVKQGPTNAGWQVMVDRGAKEIVLDGSRIGVVDTANRFSVKEGALNAGWDVVATSVAQAELSGTRIAVRETTGRIQVKEGATNAGWDHVADGIDVAISGDRIGIIDAQGRASVKQGATNAGWDLQTTDATDIELGGTRIGVVSKGMLSVKDGALNAGWSVVAGPNTTQFLLTGDLVGVVSGGNADMKQGALNAGWQRLMNGSTRVDVSS